MNDHSLHSCCSVLRTHDIIKLVQLYYQWPQCENTLAIVTQISFNCHVIL